MKLIVVRHAKSSWDSPNLLADHDRPLAPRGERAAGIIGKWLCDNGHIPAAVICSSALRTRQTWELMQPHLKQPESLNYSRKLYHANSNQYWKAVRNSALSPLLILGHNPGIGDFAASAVEKCPVREDFDRYPTAATMVCVFSAEYWQNVHQATGQLVEFTVPRDHQKITHR